ncbi:MAG: CHAT domain-containing protein, partial [SAR324 cluster bacterium]|nr:CHAT domain-containing protein [SAR324 cluster bacterium]
GTRGKKQADGTDGILTAMEVLSMDLAGTRLVVLSACETGLGDIKQGEGVYGLRRAFQEAGAAAVLSTLWQVDDDGTQAFMTRFYTLFLEGKGAQESARAVQREFIASSRWAHPFYWAPFVMVGAR